jgi:tetratricopeptide (TPR) repeat protein
MGRNTSAKKMIDEALRRLQSIPDSTLIMEATAIQAQILNSLGKMEASVQAIQPVLSFAYRHKNKKLEHACTNLLGGIELQNGRADMALQYFNRSLELAMTLPYPEFQLYDQMQKGYALLFTNNIPEGQALLDKSIQDATAQGDTLTLTVATLIQAYLSQSRADVTRWKSEIQKAIQLASAMGHETMLSGAYSQLLEYHISKKDYSAAIRAGNQAMDLIHKQPMPLFEVYLDSLMYTVHKDLGNTIMALTYFESFHKNKEAILNSEQLSLLREQKSQFELREKNLIIDNQHLQLANSRKEKILLIILNVIFALAIAAGI